MTGYKALIDTNILLYYFKGIESVKPLINYHITHFTFITELEVLSFPGLSKKENLSIRQYFSKQQIIGYLPELRDLTIKIRSENTLKLPDAIIAATALHYDLFIITADRKFRQVPNLRCLYYDPAN